MKFAPLIWSALWRRPTEFTLSWLAITVAFMLFGLMVGLNGTYRALITVAREDRLYVNARFGNPDGLPLAMRTQLQRVEGVTGVSAASLLCGYHAVPRNQQCVYFVDDAVRIAWSELSITAAQWDQLLATRDGLLISRSAADRWNLRAGDMFPLIANPGNGADGPPVWEFKVLAVVPSDKALWNGSFLIGNYQYYNNVVSPGRRDRVNVFRLAVADGRRSSAIGRRIDRFFANSGTPTLSVSARADAQADAQSSVDMASMTRIVATAGLFMILFLTANAVARSVRERMPEFAVLKTIGFSAPEIERLVFFEAAVPCLTGAVLGTSLATVLAGWQMRFISPLMLSILRPNVSPLVWACAIGLALVLAFLSSVVPIMRLRRLDVAAALAGK